MPFLKGSSGNPGGRPKGLAAMVREKTKDNAQQVEWFHRVAQGLEVDADFRDRMEAHKWLADRGSGKAVETVVHHEAEGDPLKPLTTEELRTLAKTDEPTQY